MPTHIWDRKGDLRNRISRGEGDKAAVRRLGDIAIACCLLAATLPILMAIALGVKCESPGPVLYRTTRIGRDGRRFELLHFRTFRHDSDVRRNRSRTGVGEFLYATRMDCLPQVFNLLRGDLTIFGAGLPAWSCF